MRLATIWAAVLLVMGVAVVVVAAADDTADDLNSRVAKIHIGSSTLDAVTRALGDPHDYAWESKTYTRDKLPPTYVMNYDGGLSLVLARGRVMEVRVTNPAYVLQGGGIHVGSSADEVFAAIAKPRKTVDGQPMPTRPEDATYYDNLGGTAGTGYYAAASRGVRFFFEKGAVSAIYLTRDQSPGPTANGQSAAATTQSSPAARFLELLANHKSEAAGQMLDTPMRKAATDEQVQAVWDGLIAKFGAFEKQTGLRSTKLAGYDVNFVGCEFAKGSVVLRVAVSPGGKIGGLFIESAGAKGASDMTERDADYVKRAAFDERPVTIGEGRWSCPGTLSLPKTGRPYPAVVLVHGSGPNDRDETVDLNKPFKDLAQGLASRGIAVLRYDKRTYAHRLLFLNSGEPVTVKQESVDDAVTAAGLLRGNKDIDPARVFILGHSLGGMLVPRIAAAAEEATTPIAGYVILAGATRPLEDVMVEQVQYICALDGTVSAEEEKAIQSTREMAARVKALDAAVDPPAKEQLGGAPAEYWLDLRGYDPAAAARAVKAPMLILHGQRDYQVTMKDSVRWKEHLAGRADVTIKEYPAINHLFVAGEGASTPAEYQRPGHVDAAVVQDIADWITGPRATAVAK